MMDFFGIGNSVKSLLNTHFSTLRRTGRTTNLVKSLKDGDRVVFTNENEAKRVKNIAKEKGLTINTLVVNPRESSILSTMQKHRTILDHSWVEEYYSQAIKKAGNDLTYIEKSLSGDRNSPKPIVLDF